MNDQIRIFISLVVATCFFYLLFGRTVPQPADALYVNGTIYTMDADGSIAEALAVRADKVVGVGKRKEVEERVRPREVIDLEGKTVFPGFIDAHAHLMSLGVARITVDLVGTSSESQAAEKVRQRVALVGQGVWIRGRGWDQNDWRSRRFPNRSILDRVAPANPVYLTRIDGHAAWVNTRALETAGVTKETQDPAGGRILRDNWGNPTGVLIDAAMGLVFSRLPPLSEAEATEAFELATRECLSYGLTTVHDMGVDEEDIALYKRFIDEGKFPFRVYAAVSGRGDTWKKFLETGPLIGYGDHRLTVRALKMYVDGALGSRGAALIEPYSDDPENRGLTVTSEDELQKGVNEALDHGFQVCTHAIGDRGNNIVLNVYEHGLQRHPVSDHRLRVEHAQVLSLDDIPRFKKLGVVPSMQETHCTSDMYWAEARLGSLRIRGAYAWRSLLETGVVIPGGSDFPVEHPNPLFGIYAGMTRQDQAGLPRSAEDVRKYFQLSKDGITDPSAFNGGWYVNQKMTREEAVRSFTSWAAWGGFEEDLKGSLAEGKLADFVVLSSDIMKMPPQQILRTVVEKTVVGGRVVYRRALQPM